MRRELKITLKRDHPQHYHYQHGHDGLGYTYDRVLASIPSMALGSHHQLTSEQGSNSRNTVKSRRHHEHDNERLGGCLFNRQDDPNENMDQVVKNKATMIEMHAF